MEQEFLGVVYDGVHAHDHARRVHVRVRGYLAFPLGFESLLVLRLIHALSIQK